MLLYPYNDMPLNHEMQWTTVTYNNIDEPQNNFAVQKNPSKKECMLYDSIYIKFYTTQTNL
jgi:hypothetical protein